MAYHHFAKMYHPDNVETADEERFYEIVEAYKSLKDPSDRDKYDAIYADQPVRQGAAFNQAFELGLDEKTALNDAEVQNNLLLALYRRRREYPTDAGLVGWLLQESLGIDEKSLEFHIWFLKSKDFINIDEQGKLAITVTGVDQIVSQSRMKKAETLQITRPRKPGADE